MLWWVFHALIAVHIVLGAIGLVAFWVPVVGKKGGDAHRRWGRVFNRCMIGTAGFALAMSTCTLIDPIGTHPHLSDADMVRGIFGWMMQYLAVLTMNLAWYGWLCVTNGRRHERNREWRNMALQVLLAVTAVNCAVQGWLIDQPLMIGMSLIGFATVGTNLRFLLDRSPPPKEWLREHVKALVGTGISVYTAFFAFGAVRIMPEIALNPALWAVPLVVGMAIILYHWRKVALSVRPARG
ncbi:MAG: hypothetical protein ACK5WM_04435 [Rhodospirillales bacterium]